MESPELRRKFFAPEVLHSLLYLNKPDHPWEAKRPIAVLLYRWWQRLDTSSTLWTLFRRFGDYFTFNLDGQASRTAWLDAVEGAVAVGPLIEEPKLDDCELRSVRWFLLQLIRVCSDV